MITNRELISSNHRRFPRAETPMFDQPITEWCDAGSRQFTALQSPSTKDDVMNRIFKQLYRPMISHITMSNAWGARKQERMAEARGPKRGWLASIFFSLSVFIDIDQQDFDQIILPTCLNQNLGAEGSACHVNCLGEVGNWLFRSAINDPG